jgi:recombination protein RecT
MSNIQTTNKNPVAAFSNILEKMKPQLALALPKHMSADRMARLVLTAFSTNPELQKCKTDSILGSLMTATQLGLEPGINGQGYLIPYKGTCTFVPGWKGLVDLVARSGRATVWTGAVYDGDKFDYQLGDEPFCRHKPGDSEGNFTHVYAIGRVKDAQMPVIEVWTRGKVKKHLDQYNKVGARHYAHASENNFEMYAKKVALLQVLKYMPSSIELANAIEVSHASEAGKGVVIDGECVTILQNVDEETGEIHQPAKEPVFYPKESFDANFGAWEKLINSGKRTNQEVIQMVEAKGKLTEQQKAQILSIKVQPPAPMPKAESPANAAPFEPTEPDQPTGHMSEHTDFLSDME